MTSKKRKSDAKKLKANYSLCFDTDVYFEKIKDLSVEQDQFFELHRIISEALEFKAFEIVVIRVTGLRLPLIAFLRPKRKYAPLFDQRIYTEKLLGKPSPGLPPPAYQAA
jgi:hypothetical protein